METEKLNEMGNYSPSNKRLYFGIALIVFGALLVLEKLNIIPNSINDILISWQMILIVIGAFSISGGKKTTGTILIVIGSVFLIPDIVNIPYEVRQIGWPLIIIAIGIVLLVTHGQKKYENAPTSEQESRKTDSFDDFVIFGGREVLVNSQNFYGGKTTSMFGGTEYDFRQAKLSQNGAVVDCVSVFGGCSFIVPPDWTVKNEVTAVFGAFSDKRGSTSNHIVTDPSKVLVIKGATTFGGIEIKYF
jgi:predicted membrane protein